jgi:hypothetical protein
MGMRKKLIGVLDDLPVDDEWYGNEEIADHLLANDVVKVVRCKDCKHYENKNINLLPHCTLCGTTKFEDDFCSCGERREGE